MISTPRQRSDTSTRTDVGTRQDHRISVAAVALALAAVAALVLARVPWIWAVTHPELSVDWHRYMNWKRPNEVMHGSNDEYMWECVNGHTARRSIPHRIKSHGCAICPWSERAGNKMLAYLAA